MTYAEFIADATISAAGLADTAVYGQPLVTQILEEVGCLLPLSRWSIQCTSCNRRELAIKYLTAHRLTVLRQTGAIGGNNQTSGLISGQISSISASQGNQSVSFSQSSGETSGAGWLAEGQTPTVWWTFFQALMGTRRVAVGFTV